MVVSEETARLDEERSLAVRCSCLNYEEESYEAAGGVNERSKELGSCHLAARRTYDDDLCSGARSLVGGSICSVNS